MIFYRLLIYIKLIVIQKGKIDMKRTILYAATLLSLGTLCCNLGTQAVPTTMISQITASAEEAAGNLIVQVSGLSDLSGVTITVTGNGKTYTEITNDSGQAVFSRLPVNDSSGNPITYTIRETIPDGYLAASAMTMTLSAGSTIIASIPNTKKTYTIAIDCKDYKTGSTEPSGDAVLSGGSYTVYHDGKVYDTYSIDADGLLCEFTLHGDSYEGEWTVQMNEAPEGYYLDSTMQELGYYEGDTWIALNSYFPQYTHATMHLSLLPISGRFSIQGHAGDEIQVYLQSSGSYENSRITERVSLTIAEDGKATQTDMLPYGTYRIQNLTTGESTSARITTYGEIVAVDFQNPPTVSSTAVTTTSVTTTTTTTTTSTVSQNISRYRLYDSTGKILLSSGTYTEDGRLTVPDGGVTEPYYLLRVEQGDPTSAIGTVMTEKYITLHADGTYTDADTYISCYWLYDKTGAELLTSGAYTKDGKLDVPEGGVTEPYYLLRIEHGIPTSPVGTAMMIERIVLHEDGSYETYTETNNTLYGDVNLDGTINMADVILLNKYTVSVVDLVPIALANADVYYDSYVDGNDAMTLLRFQVQLIDTLPYTAEK